MKSKKYDAAVHVLHSDIDIDAKNKVNYSFSFRFIEKNAIFASEKPMWRMKKHLLSLLAVMMALHVSAQTEVGSQKLSGMDIDVQKVDVGKQLRADSTSFRTEMIQPELAAPDDPVVHSYMQQTKQGGVGLPLWKGAHVGFYGMTDMMPGLMTTDRGVMALHQNLGRWQFTASAQADKYWMPWQRTLSTQYGVGGTVAYLLGNAVSLHAFGYYYGSQLQVGPAMSPYMNTSTYGGYADIRFSSLFGTNLGVRRYVDPMTGQWETVPIVNPYINIGGGRLELPLGDLMRELVRSRDRRSHQRPTNGLNFTNGSNSMDRSNPTVQPAPQPPRTPVRPGLR